MSVAITFDDGPNSGSTIKLSDDEIREEIGKTQDLIVATIGKSRASMLML